MTNADLVIRLSALADYKSKAISGSTTTLVTSLLSDFENAYICFLSGTNKGLDRIVTASDNGTLTFAALPATVDATTEFAICEVGFLSKIESARLMVDEKFKNIGLDINLFVNSVQLDELYTYKTLEIVCRDRMQMGSENDFYYSNALYYQDLFDKTFTSLKADYDVNDSGDLDDDEKLLNKTQAWFSR